MAKDLNCCLIFLKEIRSYEQTIINVFHTVAIWKIILRCWHSLWKPIYASTKLFYSCFSQNSGMEMVLMQLFYVSFSKSGLFMSRWWSQHWTAVEMTWRWLVPPILTHPLQPRVCPTFENLLENVKIWHWKKYFLEKMELEDATSWQQHGSVMLLNLVAMIPHLVLSSVRIWKGLIVFPLKLI